jgi:hypothetical protein
VRRLEKHISYTMETGVRSEVVQEIEQPFRDWLRHVVIGRLDRLTWTAPGLKQVWRQGEKLIDDLSLRWHKRTCNGECGTYYVRLPDDPPGRFEMDEAHASPGCVHTPPSVRGELWVYDQMHRNITYLKRYDERL